MKLYVVCQFGLLAFVAMLFVVFVFVMWSETPDRIYGLLGVGGREYPKYETLRFLGIAMGGLLFVLQIMMSYKRANAMEETARSQATAASAQAKATEEQATANKNTEKGRRQERLKNAIEHLGHDADSVRLGGAYELFHLAQDTDELRQTVLDILCAHIRQTTRNSEYRELHKSKPSVEVQSLLALLFLRQHEVFEDLDINLQESWLNGADLKKARLVKAKLVKSHLRRAGLEEADLKRADLSRASLQEAELFMADLEKAELVEANMQRTGLFGTNMQWADLWGANLQGAGLSEAGPYLVKTDLRGANLFDANLRAADLGGVQLQGANLSNAQLQGAYLRDVELQGASLGNVQLQGASCECEKDRSDLFSFTKRIRRSIGRATNLSSVIFSGGLTQEDVASFVRDLPDEKISKLRRKLTSHIGKRKSNKLSKNSGANTGTYTKDDAEKWITEYEGNMTGVEEEAS